MVFDRIIIGAGIYGLYAALKLSEKTKEKILIIEKEKEAFLRATYINQARVHMGYHYPRSISTAKKSADYFNRFVEDFRFCILKDFKQIYATSSTFSWTNAEQFKKFCKDANIKCESLDPDIYFKNGMCDGAFLTEEYTYDAKILRDYFLKELSQKDNVKILYDCEIIKIEKEKYAYLLETTKGIFATGYLLNATYASTNQIIQMLSFESFKIKYELCEIILCKINEALKDIGITVMDGPFFSIMPFGKTGYHSLTSVTFTPHTTSYDELPIFKCQEKSEGYCAPDHLGNCNLCKQRPESAWPYMSKLARKYMKDDFQFKYDHSLFSMKPILMASEIDDSRPTVIKTFSENPYFISVLSGKINTVYDLDEVLK